MKTVVYDGSFEGFLCAVFDVFKHKIIEPDIVPVHRHQPSMFASPHFVNHDPVHGKRVWKGLEKKLTLMAQKVVHRAFLSEQDGIENKLLQYFKQAFAAQKVLDEDPYNVAAQPVFQAAKKLWREKNRIEGFLRFQETCDNLHFALINPTCNVLPLLAGQIIESHGNRRWLVYDAGRRYGLYCNGTQVQKVQAKFSPDVAHARGAVAVYDANEILYRQLWEKYFKGETLSLQTRTKLYIREMSSRKQDNLVEQQPRIGLSLQERLTNWTYRRA